MLDLLELVLGSECWGKYMETTFGIDCGSSSHSNDSNSNSSSSSSSSSNRNQLSKWRRYEVHADGKKGVAACDVPGQYMRIDGSTPADKRQKLIRRFNESSDAALSRGCDGPHLFLISMKAGNMGINLQVTFLSPKLLLAVDVYSLLFDVYSTMIAACPTFSVFTLYSCY